MQNKPGIIYYSFAIITRGIYIYIYILYVQIDLVFLTIEYTYIS